MLDRAMKWFALQARRAVEHPTREIIVFLVAVVFLVYGDASPTDNYASLARSFGLLLMGVAFLSLLSRDAGHHEMLTALKRNDLDFARISDHLEHEWTWRDDLGTKLSWFRRD